MHFDLPVTDAAPPRLSSTPFPASLPGAQTDREFFIEAEMLRRERENLAAVLERAGWKIKGADGAAELLGVKPTTLLSRMEKMGFRRPRG